MFVVSDLRNGKYRISALFSGVDAKDRAKRWAGAAGKVTRLRKQEIFATLRAGMALPVRYA